jgi:hypothetical protein
MKLTIALFTSITAFCYWTVELMPKAYSNAPTAIYEPFACITLSLLIIYGIKWLGRYDGQSPIDITKLKMYETINKR